MVRRSGKVRVTTDLESVARVEEDPGTIRFLSVVEGVGALSGRASAGSRCRRCRGDCRPSAKRRQL